MKCRKISDVLKEKKTRVSFEIFPPKTDSSYESVIKAAEELADCGPDFISVTYGAGGSRNGKTNTADIARHIQKYSGIPAVAHLTCISASEEQVAADIRRMKENGICNVLALRGDIPADSPPISGDRYAYASELIREIRQDGNFCIGGACYPEGHPECRDRETDLDNLKKKADAGCEFLTTQMFFDNDMLYSFLYRAQSRGITLPVFAGIMPVTNSAQIKRMMSLSNAYMPRKFLAIIDKFQNDNDALRQAGIAYATEQIVDLLTNGIRGIHIYTMNKPDVARAIAGNISRIVAACNA